jgi:hypothetical protein
MKVNLFILSFLLSLPALAMEDCGKKSTELKYPQLTWQRALTVNVNNSFQDSEGVICAGLTKTLPITLARIIYRDADGRVIDADINQLKNGVAIVADKDLPQEATPILRTGQYVVIKTQAAVTAGTKISYPISLRFLRNLSVGFSAKDFRELSLVGSILGNQIAMSYANNRFDEIEMNLASLPVAFQDIYFYQDRAMVKKVNANQLKQVPSLF